MGNGAEDLVYGTLVFILCGALGTGGGVVYFSKSSGGTREERVENAKLVRILVPLATMCLWIMYASCWLHQWHPLIMPEVNDDE